MLKKLLPFLIIILIVITLVVCTLIFGLKVLNKKSQSNDPTTNAVTSVKSVTSKPLTPAKIKQFTVQMPDITTNIATQDKSAIVGLAFELENAKAVAEFNDLQLKVKNIIIQTLADLTDVELSGSKGQDNLVSIIINKVNAIMQSGKVSQIDITNFMVAS